MARKLLTVTMSVCTTWLVSCAWLLQPGGTGGLPDTADDEAGKLPKGDVGWRRQSMNVSMRVRIGAGMHVGRQSSG